MIAIAFSLIAVSIAAGRGIDKSESKYKGWLMLISIFCGFAGVLIALMFVIEWVADTNFLIEMCEKHHGGFPEYKR